MTDHEFIDVGNRRWCVRCDLFQTRRPGTPWRKPASECPNNTPYAAANPVNKGSGGPTVDDPDRPYCKPDQSCCDFTCGN